MPVKPVSVSHSSVPARRNEAPPLPMLVPSARATMRFTLTALTLDSTHIWFSTVPAARYGQEWYTHMLASVIRQMLNVHTIFTHQEAGERLVARPRTARPATRRTPGAGASGAKRDGHPEDTEALTKLLALPEGASDAAGPEQHVAANLLGDCAARHHVRDGETSARFQHAERFPERLVLVRR